MTTPTPSFDDARAVAWLGYGGLVPFVVPALALLLGAGPSPGWWLQVLTAYGAAILSFVGALHWAFAMLLPGLTPTQRLVGYVWSTVPALLAWGVMAWLPASAWGLWALVLGLWAHYGQDRRLHRLCAPALPQWYLPLRTHLTLGASLSMAVGAVAA
jgi:hypothetical protein